MLAVNAFPSCRAMQAGLGTPGAGDDGARRQEQGPAQPALQRARAAGPVQGAHELEPGGARAMGAGVAAEGAGTNSLT